MQKWKTIIGTTLNRDRRITAAVLVAVTGVIAASLVFILNKDSMTIRESVFVSLQGEESMFEGKIRLKRKNDSMLLDSRSGEYELDGQPVYSTDSESLYLTEIMSYMNVEAGKIRKINYFGKISVKDGVQSIERDRRSRNEVNGGFLFDGKNTYLFLDPVTVTYGEDTMQLAAFSYITVLYKNSISGYSYGDKTSFIVRVPSGDVTAQSDTGKYEINLSADTMEMNNQTSIMLVSNPEVLKLIGDK